MAAEDDDQGGASSENAGHGGRILLGGMAVCAVILLALIGRQTVRGSEVSGRLDVGWWAEPGLTPAVFLGVTILASAAAFFATRREHIDWRRACADYGRVAFVSACMVGAVFLLKVLGFALSILLFAGVAAFIAGFRGGRLIAIAVGACLLMVLIFRVGFSVWFPRPELFKLIDLPLWAQGVL